jgi:hypothetical protein
MPINSFLRYRGNYKNHLMKNGEEDGEMEKKILIFSFVHERLSHEML